MKARKILSMFLIVGMFLMNVNPVYAVATATINETQTVENPRGVTTYNSKVGCSVSETYSVIIPKVISLDSNAGSSIQTCTISVSGDISGAKKVNVELLSLSFNLTQKGKPNIPTFASFNSFSLDPSTKMPDGNDYIFYNKYFECSEFQTNASQTLYIYPSAPPTAGEWEGTISFKIQTVDAETLKTITWFFHW